MSKNIKNRDRYKILSLNKKYFLISIILGITIVLMAFSFLNSTLNNFKDSSINLNNSAISNSSGVYNGGIRTMGMKIEENQTYWENLNQITVFSQNNKTYDDFIYKLNRLDIRAYNLFAKSGVIDIAYNYLERIDINGGAILAQEFKTPNSTEKITIDSVRLYVTHNLPFATYRNYFYAIYIVDGNFTEELGGRIAAVKNTVQDGWITIDNITLTKILEPNTIYNLLYFMRVEGYGIEDFSIYTQNTWKAENKSLTGTDNGTTYLISNDDFTVLDDIDMLCNLSYQETINPEIVNLTCKINDIEYTPTYQQSIAQGSSGYEAKLIYNFDEPPDQDVNITICSDTIVEKINLELREFFVYTINTSGSYTVINNMIKWNISYQYYDIGAEREELWFLFESDWELLSFYNTIGTEIEVYFGPISLYNESFYGLFDLWGNPLGFGNCLGIYQSPNYCDNINTLIKEGSTFQYNNFIQLEKSLKIEAIIESSFNEPISGGNGTMTLRNPSGQIIYQGVNLTSINGRLSSSDIVLESQYGVGIYTADVFWTNGKELAIYSMSFTVNPPEGYIPPETMILIISLIGIAILATPAALVARKYIKQINWEKSLNDLFVLTKEGASMFNFSFGIELRKPELISGMISALTTFMKEATGSKEAIRIIDQQDKKIILNHGKYVTVALIATKDLPIIHKRVKKFTEAFETRYGKQLLNWSGEITQFKDAESIVKKYFHVSIEEQKIRGVREKLEEFRERLLSINEKAAIISILREITEFSSRYQQIINNYSFNDFNELIRIAEYKINE